MNEKDSVHSSWMIPWCMLALFLILACATPPSAPPVPEGHPSPYRVQGTWYKPLPHARGFTQRGIASWYGEKFHGRKTSNGEIYNMYAMTAAHKTLPLGTWVQVRHIASGQTIKVRINDRGPFVHGRIIDLSYAGAKALNMVGPGTAEVEIMALGQRQSSSSGDTFVPVDYYNGKFTFQVGAFSNRKNAERLRTKLDGIFENAHVTAYDRGDTVFYRVRVGRCDDLESADNMEQQLINGGYPDAFIVAE